MTARDDLLRQYASGYDAVLAALAGVPADALDRRPAPGEWTAREVVHHLADSETMSSTRLRRLLCEDEPVIQGYDENEFARRLAYATRPIEPALDVLRSVRADNATLLATLTPEQWERAGTHSESGSYSVLGWLDIYAAHAHDHAEQIRAAAGVPA
jgi:hypothetical protein